MGGFLFLKPGAIEPEPGRVIRRDAYAEYVEASAVLERANQEAEKILADARDAFESEKQRGFAEGMDEGKMEMTVRMLDSAVESVNMISSMEDAIVDVVNRTVRTIVGEIDRHELVERLVKKSLMYVRDQKKVTIRLNPDDAEQVQERLESITRDFPSMVRIDIYPDVRLDPNMCMLETEMGVVDASLDKQLDLIEQALRKEVGSHGGI